MKGARDGGKAVILAGCVPTADSTLAKSLVGVSMLGVSQLDRVVEVVEQALQGNHAAWAVSQDFGGFSGENLGISWGFDR